MQIRIELENPNNSQGYLYRNLWDLEQILEVKSRKINENGHLLKLIFFFCVNFWVNNVEEEEEESRKKIVETLEHFWSKVEILIRLQRLKSI